MQRYFFHLKDGSESMDDTGTEFPDLQAVRKQAITWSGEVLRNGAGVMLWDGEPVQLWVTDQPDGKGKTFFTLTFSAAEGPASTGDQSIDQ